MFTYDLIFFLIFILLDITLDTLKVSEIKR